MQTRRILLLLVLYKCTTTLTLRVPCVSGDTSGQWWAAAAGWAGSFGERHAHRDSHAHRQRGPEAASDHRERQGWCWTPSPFPSASMRVYQPKNVINHDASWNFMNALFEFFLFRRHSFSVSCMFSPFPTEAPLPGGLHAAVLLLLRPEVTHCFPTAVYVYSMYQLVFNVSDLNRAS